MKAAQLQKVQAPSNGRFDRSVLVIEDDTDLSASLAAFLDGLGWEVRCAGTIGEALSCLSEQIFDLVLADYMLPDGEVFATLEQVQERSPLTKVLVMTGVKDLEVTVQAFKQGASDFLFKPFDVRELETRIQDVMEDRKAVGERENRHNAAPIPPNMVGCSLEMAKVYQLIELISDKNITVLVSGESGTGKELVARAVHSEGSRSRAKFVAINCGAIPDNLLESELFGHVPGAFTGARGMRVGKFEEAGEGTLFLDEVGEMPLSLQVKLLRVLEDRRVERLGSNKPVDIKARIVAATNCDLREKIKRREFRSDLFFRLNMVPIHLPPLRERREDIPLLVNHFLADFSERFGLPSKQLSPEALRKLVGYHWPGNVRELRNVLELAALLSGERTALDTADFSAYEPEAREESGEAAARLRLPEEGLDLPRVLEEFERDLIQQSLQRTGGNKQKAAELLCLKRTTLVAKLRRMDPESELCSA